MNDPIVRSDKDYAIEFGERLAKAAEHMLNEVSRSWLDNTDISHEGWTALCDAITEFRNRAWRALPHGPTSRAIGEVLLAISNGKTEIAAYDGQSREALIAAGLHSPPLITTEGPNAVLTDEGHEFLDVHAPSYYAKWRHVWRRAHPVSVEVPEEDCRHRRAVAGHLICRPDRDQGPDCAEHIARLMNAGEAALFWATEAGETSHDD